jgi:DNA-binding response OmpR family regulator
MQRVIALFDGDWAWLDILDTVLTDEGYRTVLGNTGTDAYDLIQHSQPDLVILDTWLNTRDDGWALLQRIWSSSATASIPVVVCSSDRKSLPEDLPLLRERHYVVLEKPFALADLLAQITALLL